MTSVEVLVVEDDADLREAIAEKLTSEGFRVRGAEDGIAALQLVAERMPDVILIDVRMPHMDGRAFVRAFHEAHGATAVAILALSHDAAARAAARDHASGLGVDVPEDEDARALVREVGADGSIPKTIPVDVINRYLSRRALA